MPASEGYNSSSSDVTPSNPPSRSSKGRGPRETVRDKILKVLRAEAGSRSLVGLNPKIITARIPKDAEGRLTIQDIQRKDRGSKGREILEKWLSNHPLPGDE